MYAILFHGKFETPDRDQFMAGLEKLIRQTNTKVDGKFTCQQFIDFSEVEYSEVQVLDSSSKETNQSSD